MVNAAFYTKNDQSWDLIGTLSASTGVPPTANGDMNWIDYDFKPVSSRLGRPVSLQEDTEEWLRSLVEAYKDSEIRAVVTSDTNPPIAKPIATQAYPQVVNHPQRNSSGVVYSLIGMPIATYLLIFIASSAVNIFIALLLASSSQVPFSQTIAPGYVDSSGPGTTLFVFGAILTIFCSVRLLIWQFRKVKQRMGGNGYGTVSVLTTIIIIPVMIVAILFAAFPDSFQTPDNPTNSTGFQNPSFENPQVNQRTTLEKQILTSYEAARTYAQATNGVYQNDQEVVNYLNQVTQARHVLASKTETVFLHQNELTMEVQMPGKDLAFHTIIMENNRAVEVFAFSTDGNLPVFRYLDSDTGEPLR